MIKKDQVIEYFSEILKHNKLKDDELVPSVFINLKFRDKYKSVLNTKGYYKIIKIRYKNAITKISLTISSNDKINDLKPMEVTWNV